MPSGSNNPIPFNGVIAMDEEEKQQLMEAVSRVLSEERRELLPVSPKALSRVEGGTVSYNTGHAAVVTRCCK